MNILVLLKPVSQLQFADTLKDTDVRLEGGHLAINPADLYALELALRVKDKVDGVLVTAMTMGPAASEGELRQALAMGADRAILLEDKRLAGSDTLATARTLAAAMEKLPKQELILCGKKAIDSETGYIGPQLAQLLGYALATNVTEFSVQENEVIVTCLRDTAVSEYRGHFPAVLTICNGVTMVRVPTLMALRRSKDKCVEKVTLDDMNLIADMVGISGSMTRVVQVENAEFRKGSGRKITDITDGIKEILSILREEVHVDE